MPSYVFERTARPRSPWAAGAWTVMADEAHARAGETVKAGHAPVVPREQGPRGRRPNGASLRFFDVTGVCASRAGARTSPSTGGAAASLGGGAPRTGVRSVASPGGGAASGRSLAAGRDDAPRRVLGTAGRLVPPSPAARSRGPSSASAPRRAGRGAGTASPLGGDSLLPDLVRGLRRGCFCALPSGSGLAPRPATAVRTPAGLGRPTSVTPRDRRHHALPSGGEDG